jgi:hypothetical protein
MSQSRRLLPGSARPMHLLPPLAWQQASGGVASAMMGLLVARPCASTLRRCRHGEQRRRALPWTRTTSWRERVGERSKQGEVSKEEREDERGRRESEQEERVDLFFSSLCWAAALSPSLDHHKKEHRLCSEQRLSSLLSLGAARLARARERGQQRALTTRQACLHAVSAKPPRRRPERRRSQLQLLLPRRRWRPEAMPRPLGPRLRSLQVSAPAWDLEGT